jgi:hypothetical protein
MPLDLEAAAPNDFDFILGTWRVTHRRLKSRFVNSTEWVEFEGLSSTEKVLGGFGNVEDNRLFFSDGEVRALALRSFDRHSKNWSIWWLDGRNPTDLGTPVVGRFEEGIGRFNADDQIDGRSVKVRFIWRSLDANHARWEQAFSADGGTSWETNWTMDFRRLEPSGPS